MQQVPHMVSHPPAFPLVLYLLNAVHIVRTYNVCMNAYTICGRIVSARDC